MDEAYPLSDGEARQTILLKAEHTVQAAWDLRGSDHWYDLTVSLDVSNEVSFLSTALWMTSCGMGPSIMPAAYLRYSRDPDLVARPLSGPRVSRDIYVLVKEGRSLSPAARQLVQVLHARMKAFAG